MNLRCPLIHQVLATVVWTTVLASPALGASRPALARNPTADPVGDPGRTGGTGSALGTRPVDLPAAPVRHEQLRAVVTTLFGLAREARDEGPDLALPPGRDRALPDPIRTNLGGAREPCAPRPRRVAASQPRAPPG